MKAGIDKRIGRLSDRPRASDHVRGPIDDLVVSMRDVSWFRKPRRNTAGTPRQRKYHASIGNRAACDGAPLSEYTADGHRDVYARDAENLCGRTGCHAIFARLGAPTARDYRARLLRVVRDYQLDHRDKRAS
jgi:hypothetical protein